MNRADTQAMKVRWGIGTVAVAVVFTLLVFVRPSFLEGGTELRAAFVTSNNLTPRSPVRIAGVQVGRVEEVEAGPGGRGALVRMHLDEGVQVHRDARLRIRPKIVLEGNYYVDLQPGSPSEPLLGDRAVVPVQQTATPVQLNQVLGALQADTRGDLQDVLDEYGQALGGGAAQALNRTADLLAPAYRESAIAAEASLGEADDDVERFIDHAGGFARALTRDRRALQDLVGDFAVTATALAREDVALRAAVGELPRTFTEGERGLRSLEAGLPAARELVQDLRPAVRTARPAIEQGLRLTGQLRGLMSRAELGSAAPRLRATVPSLARLTSSSRAVNAQLRELSNCQVQTFLPATEDKIPDTQFPTRYKVYQQLAQGFGGAAGESRSFDANGQYVKVGLQGANYAYATQPGAFFFTQTPLQGVNPGPQPLPAFRPDQPCEDQQIPDLRSNPVAPPRAIEINRTSSAYVRRFARARGRAVRWLRKDLKKLGLADRFRVVSDELQAGQLPALRSYSARLRRGGK